MDDPGEWAEPWPYWKFGLKQHDLHDSLHTKYNTILSAIQDPEAFHHDVYELSTRADTLSEFEQLMEERKTLRLKELNSMLEDASFQIVGCPRLIGTDQWPVAVQLFRTRSLDSLVRYFASYLPDEHPWHRDSDSHSSDAPSPVSPVAYGDYDGPVLFDDPEEDETFYTHDSSESFSTCGTAVDLIDLADQPARSNTMLSMDSGVSVTEHKQQLKLEVATRSTSPAMSVSESESEPMAGSLIDSVPTLHEDEAASQSEDPESPSTSIPDISQDNEKAQGKDALMTTIVDDEDVDGFMSISHAQLVAIDTMGSDTPTSKTATARSPAAPATPLFDTNCSPLQARSLSSNVLQWLDNQDEGMAVTSQNDKNMYREDEQVVGGNGPPRVYGLERELGDDAMMLSPAVAKAGVLMLMQWRKHWWEDALLSVRWMDHQGHAATLRD